MRPLADLKCLIGPEYTIRFYDPRPERFGPQKIYNSSGTSIIFSRHLKRNIFFILLKVSAILYD